MPFVSDDILHELHSAVFAQFIPRCESCRKKDCYRPTVINHRGDQTHATDPDRRVLWPRCAGQYAILREWGQDLTTLDEICGWVFETGAHRDPEFGASGSRVMREYLRIRELPPKMFEAKIAHERALRSGSNV